MKVFGLLLVSVALCSAASLKKLDKKVKKRGLIELGQANFGNIYNPSYGAYSVPAYQSLAAPFIPSPQLIPETNTFVHTSPVQYAQEHSPASSPVQYAQENSPASSPVQYAQEYSPAFQFAASPAIQQGYAAEQEVPTHVRTLVKHVHVPYERIIKVDNPIYTHFDRHVPVDHPVPVIKIVKQPVPVHIEQPIPIPVFKEIRESQPYTHKVRLILQQVFVKNQEPTNTYLPPAQPQNEYLPPQQNEQQLSQPQNEYLPPQQPQLNAPSNNYGPPAPEPQHFNAPAPAPSNSYVPPTQQHFEAPAQHFDAPAPSKNYIPPQTQHFDAPAPSTSHFSAPAPSNSYVPPAQNFEAPPSSRYGPPQKFNRSIGSRVAPPRTSYGVPERRGYH